MKTIRAQWRQQSQNQLGLVPCPQLSAHWSFLSLLQPCLITAYDTAQTCSIFMCSHTAQNNPAKGQHHFLNSPRVCVAFILSCAIWMCLFPLVLMMKISAHSTLSTLVFMSIARRLPDCWCCSGYIRCPNLLPPAWVLGQSWRYALLHPLAVIFVLLFWSILACLSFPPIVQSIAPHPWLRDIVWLLPVSVCLQYWL